MELSVPGWRRGGDESRPEGWWGGGWRGGERGGGRGGDADGRQVQVPSRLQHKKETNILGEHVLYIRQKVLDEKERKESTR